MLNVFNLMEWRFDLLSLAQCAQFGTFVNPPVATLTRGSPKVEKKPWQGTRESVAHDMGMQERSYSLRIIQFRKPNDGRPERQTVALSCID